MQTFTPRDAVTAAAANAAANATRALHVPPHVAQYVAERHGATTETDWITVRRNDTGEVIGAWPTTTHYLDAVDGPIKVCQYPGAPILVVSTDVAWAIIGPRPCLAGDADEITVWQPTALIATGDGIALACEDCAD